MTATELTPQQQGELDFWRGLIASVGEEYFYAYRVSEYYEKTRYFRGWLGEDKTGRGVDWGCGAISVFEGAPHINCDAVDPLNYKYAEMFRGYPGCKLVYSTGIRAQVHDAFDWAACINVIDHTPDPAALLADIRSVLKPGGVLYFEVNFEQSLYSPHYTLWDMDTVREHFATGWRERYGFLQHYPEANQKRWWAEYVKED